MVRKDYKDVILNTGRTWGSVARKNQRVKDDDMDAQCAPMRNYKDRKQFGDRVTPLYRYLHKQVGRPWNKVYSELCKQTDPRSIRGFHLRSHIDDIVVPNDRVIKTDKGYRELSRWAFRSNDGVVSFSKDALFVDDNGMLRAPKRHEMIGKRDYQKISERRNKTFIRVTETSAHIYFSDQWWHVEWINYNDFDEKRSTRFDKHRLACKRFLMRDRTMEEYRLVNRDEIHWDEAYIVRTQTSDNLLLIYPTVKRQLSKHDVRKFGLAA